MKSNSDRIRETHDRADFQEWVAGLALQLEAAWKTGTPTDTPVTIRLDDLLDMSLTWLDMRQENRKLKKQAKDRTESAAMAGISLPYLHGKPGRSYEVDDGTLYLFRVTVPERIMEENAELFEVRDDFGT